ncbi:MAG: hypothetical protein ACRDRL_02810 [Sciscionella sp.]
MADNQNAPVSRSAGLFDLRYILALLFIVYGVVLTIMGLVSFSAADRAKTGDININLWAGVIMIVVALLFAGWAWLRPVRVNIAAPERAEQQRSEPS